MYNKRGYVYGILLLLLLTITMIGLITSKTPTTGFAVKSDKCFEGTAFGQCSPVQPKYCDNGALKLNCNKCGCIEGEVCQSDNTCLRQCSDGTLFGQCSQNKPLLCSKGILLENCFKCGCSSGQTCLNDGTCAEDAQVEIDSDEEKIVEEEKIIEKPEEINEIIFEEEQKPNIKEEPKVGFWKSLFCRIFYANEYDTCIS